MEEKIERIFQCEECGNMWSFENNFCPKCSHLKFRTFIPATLIQSEYYEKEFVEWFYKGSYVLRNLGSGRPLESFYNYWLKEVKKVKQ